MLTLDSVACADTFPANPGAANTASLYPLWGSNGGFAAVTGADVMVQIAFGTNGQPQWSQPVHVAPGNIILAPGTVGVQFRNYVPGSVATVSAALSAPNEPALAPTSAGVSTPTVAKVITGIVAGTGIITAGSGFAVVRNSQGNYTVTFSASFSGLPVIVGVANGLDEYLNVENIAAGGFTCSTPNHSGVGQDSGFSFLAQLAV